MSYDSPHYFVIVLYLYEIYIFNTEKKMPLVINMTAVKNNMKKFLPRLNTMVWIVVIVSVLCTSYSCCLSNGRWGTIPADATHLKRNAFVLAEVSYNLFASECIENCKDAPKNLKIDSMQARGSGAVIAHRRNVTYLITAGHVCEHKFPDKFIANEVSYTTRSESIITFYDLFGTSHDGNIVYVDHGEDICIVESTGIWGTPVEIAEEMPSHGERVFNIAAPFGIYSPKMVLIFEGFYTGADMKGNEFFTVPCRPGSSGSPVFNSQGELISVIHSASIMFENLGLGSRLEIIQQAIRAHVPSQVDPLTYYLQYREFN